MTNFQFNYNRKNLNLDVTLPGGSAGIESDLIQKILQTSYNKGYSSLSCNYPFYMRGENATSSKEFREEIDNLLLILKFCEYETYNNIRLIGKSLGATIAGYYLSKLQEKVMDGYSIVVLGYDLGDINLNNFIGDIHIIQGGYDRYGNIIKIKEDLEDAKSKLIRYDEIKGADHSYKNPNTGEFEFENEAISKIYNIK
ncbi:MAG: alpha/beta family hydrolase [Patescibacteria group bacterium]